MEEISNKNGFLSENYEVETEDGYILGVYRIPGMLNETLNFQKPSSKPAVLLFHSLEVDMMEWFVNDPEVAHAFVLARAGYDVWFGNERGTRFSNKHVKLDPKVDKQYWNFTWEEMGTKDAPAVIDHILEVTGRENVTYMGHSQGTTMMVAGASLLPDFYNKKLNGALLLAPPIAMIHEKTEIMRLLSEPDFMKDLFALFYDEGILDFIPYDKALAEVLVEACELVGNLICGEVGGLDPKLDNLERAKVFASNLPGGASAFNFIHYG